MSVLVTGAAGLIGSHLCKRLVDEGYEVVGLIHRRANPVIKCLLRNNNLRLEIGDIRNGLFLNRVVARYKVTTIFHTAAQLPYTPKKDLVGVNVRGTLNLLNAAHCNKVKEFIYASSMGVYSSPPNYIPVDELHSTNPSTVYGVTKLAGELSCGAYAESMEIFILRYAGVYGVSSEKNRAVNNFIRCALRNKPLVVDGDGSQSSDFTYVNDIVEGTYLSWIKKTQGIYNIGSGKNTTLMELAKLIIGITNSKSEIIQNGKKVERPFRFYLDISKARTVFDYSPCLLEDGLRAYVREFSE